VKKVKQAFWAILLICGLGVGFFYGVPYLQTNTKPKNWSAGEKTYVPQRLKNTMKGMSTGF
tara:strand:+ start:310 stop:492 length:183 start_codon:yes stop_codon:yes gene_type:complete